MVAVIKFATPDTIASELTTSLNALANSTSASTGKAVGAIVDNATNLFEWMDLVLTLASLTPAAGGRIEVYLLYAVDGSTYETGSTTVDPNGPPTTVFYLNNVAGTVVTTQREGAIRLRPFKFKMMVRNLAGVALGATSNTLQYVCYNEQVV